MSQAGKISQFVDLFANSGEIGQLFCELDWVVTPLETLTNWSRS